MTAGEQCFQHGQRGAALAVALVMLVVLTILGVAGMNKSVSELLMAGNTQYQSRALNSAENTIVATDVLLATLLPQDTYTQKGIYNASPTASGTKDVIKIPATLAWNSGDSEAGGDANSRYIVEYLGAQAPPGNTLKAGGSGTATNVDLFRITARSEDGKGAVRLVQSLFVKP